MPNTLVSLWRHALENLERRVVENRERKAEIRGETFDLQRRMLRLQQRAEREQRQVS